MILTDTLIFLAKTLPLIAVATYLVSYSISKGLMERLAERISFLLRGLDEIIVTSVAVCFISPLVAYSMLSQALKDGKIDEREVIAASFLNSFPSTFSHIYSFFLPFVIPLLGWAGIVYTAIRLGVALVKSALGYVLALRWRKGGRIEEKDVSGRRIDPLKSTLDNLKRIAPTLAITYAVVRYLSVHHFFDRMSAILSFLPLDPNVVALSMVEFVNVRMAVIVASGFLQNGVLTPKWVVIGLMLGNVITFSTRFVKHSLPMHLSLFGRLGIKIVAINAIVTLLLDVTVILLLLSLPSPL